MGRKQPVGQLEVGPRSARQRRRCWSLSGSATRSPRSSSRSFSSAARPHRDGPRGQGSSGPCAARRGTGDGQGVDRVRLARGALAAAAWADQLRRDPDRQRAHRGHQEALEGARDVAAVLTPPDPLLPQATAPVEQLGKARLARQGRSARRRSAWFPGIPPTQVCVCLWRPFRSRSWTRPFDWLSPRVYRRRTNLTWGKAKLLSSHGGDPREAASDETHGGQTLGSTASLGVSSPPFPTRTNRPRSDACRRP